TVKEALKLAEGDLDTATALLSVRRIAGDEALADELATKALAQWRKAGKRWLMELDRRNAERHAAAQEVAFLLEPNLKEGRGGLRDVHVLGFAELAGFAPTLIDHQALGAEYEVILSARVALHRGTGRNSDVLLLEEQDAVAANLGYLSADALMASVAGAARTIAWSSDEAWHELRRALIGNTSRRSTPVSGGIWLRDGEIALDDEAQPAKDPTLLLRVAAAAARHGTRIDRGTLDRLAAEAPDMVSPWPAGAVDELVAMLLTGRPMIQVVESLEHRGLMTRVLPEWEAVRSKPQRNALHRFTVDRHLLEATANAAGFQARVSRPDLLVLGTLLHDIGKGYPGDHTEAGLALMSTICPRLGLSAEDAEVICQLVRHHLLLPITATSRDIADDATITAVADAAGSALVLELLAALTEADSLATGPSAWSPWKAELVADLVSRTQHVLGGGEVHEVAWSLFPSAEVEALMGARQLAIRQEGDTVTVVAPDRPGVFSKVAGVISLHGLDVLSAQAHSDEQGMAASEFRVLLPQSRETNWGKVIDDIDLALAGRLAIEARLADRARTYARRRTKMVEPVVPSVTAHNNASSNATVLEVRANDKIGVLYRITRALADMQLDIRHAKVSSLGGEALDAFYVCDSDGHKILDPAHLGELERAILHALTAG
ncbi:MAG: glnD, partial [Acidimicrobiia bacterium]|nr:glnD [Acidimicrobiia bacterium]